MWLQRAQLAAELIEVDVLTHDSADRRVENVKVAALEVRLRATGLLEDLAASSKLCGR